MSSNNKKVESLTTVSQKIREYFKPKPKPKYSYWNPYADKGVDDEYFIDEIIGIEELPYKEFNKEEKKEPEEIPYLGLEDREYYEEQLQGIFPKESIRKMSDDNLLEFVKNYTTSEGGSQ